ncbi:MAG: hypothetical protein HZA36_01640 [Parcubacteria group bacterium]|nr:hypothetical protein [Parcubacteria group bacterium]
MIFPERSRRVSFLASFLVIALLSTFIIFPRQVFADTGYSFFTKWGSTGSSNSQFDDPSGLAIIDAIVGSSTAPEIFVVEYNNNRVQKFTNTGGFISTWGSHGTGNGQFTGPRDIVAAGNTIYVVDASDPNAVSSGNNRIQKFTRNGDFISKFGSYVTGDGQFNDPYGACADSSGNLYVADTGNNRIQKFDTSGTFLAKWGSTGTGNGQFQSPTGCAFDSSGNIYVTDYSKQPCSEV